MKLEDSVSTLPGVGPSFAVKLKKLSITTIEDLLLHVPTRLEDFSLRQQINQLKMGEPSTIVGQIISIQNIYTKTGKMLQIAKVSDGVSSLEAIWVNQPYLVRTLPEGTYVALSGKLGFWGKKRAFVFPQFEKFSGEHTNTGRLLPVYPETAGLSSKWLRARVKRALSDVTILDFLDTKDLNELGLVLLEDAFNKIHSAEVESEFEEGVRRLAFNEFLLLQIENNLNKLWWRQNSASRALAITNEHKTTFTHKLPFTLTDAQTRSINEILNDIKSTIPMNRLLEGDVGSGKTVVAAAAMFASFVNSQKSVILAPTQILARQHFETLNKIFEPFKMRISLVTSEGVLSDLGQSDITIGTHALLFREEHVKNAAFLAIDEQHRFGVAQRARIAQIAKSGKYTPHILTMTATPIPRTIALTLYGDLELSTLDELPKGRKTIKTWVVPPSKRKKAEAWISEQIAKNKIQAFIVCPLIEESTKETFKTVKAVTKEFERLKLVFKHLKVALLHGKMKASEKSKIIKDFKNKKYDILVSTPVIEVGIDIPNATIMVIEAAERFGLASIHQLRGRVGRGNKQSYCLLFTESKSPKVKERLNAVSTAKTGKELAEIDLENRGPGELLGIRQSGISELRIAKWNDLELIKKSRDFAFKVVNNQEKYKSVLVHYRKKQKAPN